MAALVRVAVTALEPWLEREVLRVNGRFNAEVVEAFSVCPYARGARLSGASVREVSAATTVEQVLGFVERLEQRDEVEVCQLILPLIGLDAPTFQGFASDVGRAIAARSPARPVFVQAAFHPDLTFSAATPHRLVPFFRRSPDPMIQFVRLKVLDALHEGRPRGTMFFDGSLADLKLMLEVQRESVTERITRDNHARAVGGEQAAIEAALGDIRADRDRSYGSALVALAGEAAKPGGGGEGALGGGARGEGG